MTKEFREVSFRCFLHTNDRVGIEHLRWIFYFYSISLYLSGICLWPLDMTLESFWLHITQTYTFSCS
jgi:hypothetical protein